MAKSNPIDALTKPGATSADTKTGTLKLPTPVDAIHSIGNVLNPTAPAAPKTKKPKKAAVAPVAASAPPSAASAFGLDPLSTQLFYAGTIAPLLQQNNQRMMDYAGAMQKSLGQAPASGLPKDFASLFAHTGKDLGNEYGFLSNALANATASAPAIDSIMNYVNQDRSQQIKTYDIIQKMLTDQAGTTGLPANIAALLGITPTTAVAASS